MTTASNRDGFAFFSNVARDLRFAWRSYRRAPLLAGAIVLTLALGIGAVGAIFSVVNAVILQPLPYDEPDELVLVTSQFPTMGFDRFWLSPPEYFELEAWNQSYDAVAGYRAGDVSIVGTPEPMRVRAMYSTASLAPLLGVSPIQGRWFTEEEDAPNTDDVVVLGEQIWRDAFNADPNVIGKRLELDGDPTTVIGVMPGTFDIEESGALVFLPVQLDRSNTSNRGSHFLNTVARLTAGTSFEMARQELDALVANWEERAGAQHVPNPETHPYRLLSLHEEVVGDTRPALLALLGAVGFVLLIACVNVANLLLSRSETRQREIAVRNIMGASKGRVVQQVLTESVALSLVSGVLGLLLANWGLHALLRANADALPRAGEVTLDWRVAAFAAGIAVLTGILFGLAPALRMGTRRFVESLREGGGQRTSQSGAAKRVRQGLVAAELALAVALLVGAGLLIKSLTTLLAVDPGFSAEKLTSVELYLPNSGYAEDTDRAAFLDRLGDELMRAGGIRSISATSDLPPQRTLNANDTEFEGLERTEDGPPHNTDYWEFVTDGYLETMGVRVLAGRAFEPSDGAESPPIVMINQKLAETFYPDQDPIGRRLRPGFGEMPWFTIVGVLEDVKQNGLDQESGTHLYFHYDQAAAAGAAPNRMYLLVRGEESTEALQSRIRETIWRLDPNLPLSRIEPMEEVVVASASRSRLLALLLGLFAGAALFLAAIGIYGVLAYSVSSRGHEIGIRMALGADRSRVLSQVLGQGMTVTAIGLFAGLGVALALSRWIRSLLFGVAPNDPTTFIAVAATLLVVSLLACAVPALRATRVNPLNALRHD